MRVIRTLEEMLSWVNEQAITGNSIGLVPTMGFFHEGHQSLMRMAGQHADRVVVSLFVNPIQFGPNEDFETYPRDFERDCSLAEQEGVNVVFAPDPEEMYPDGFQTTVSVGRITRHLCGASRPGHFDGVSTVLTKLFNVVRPHCAVFGEKDYQQLAVIRRMVEDLNIDVVIIGHPIVREKDGLALSSRNTYLKDDERASALCLYKSLELVRRMAGEGERETAEMAMKVVEFIESFAGTKIDYVSFVDNRSLEPVATVDEKTLLALAVKINGRVRLIDNGMVLLNEWQ